MHRLIKLGMRNGESLEFKESLDLFTNIAKLALSPEVRI
jgi:hypothetical protein